MSDGDRALDELRVWLCVKLLGVTRIGANHFSGPLPDVLGRDWPQLAEALQGEPHKFEVCLWFYPARPWAPAHCEASIWAEGKPSPVAEESADTPGLALGRAAEQALGGAGQNGE